MVDLKKRITLKTISGAAALVAAPAIATAGNCFHGDAHKASMVSQAIPPTTSNAELSIALTVDTQPTLCLTNHSNKPLQLKHVYPGTIHAGEKTFDINSILGGDALTLGAGETRTLNIKPNKKLQAEVSFPREQYRHKPQRIVAVTGKDSKGDIVNSTRSFFA